MEPSKLFLIPKLISKRLKIQYFSVFSSPTVWYRNLDFSLNNSDRKCYSTKLRSADDDEDKPIVYTKSRASQWQAKSSRRGTDSERLWYEPIVALTSIGVFLIYFCILREENDVDAEFDKSLYSRVKGLEEVQLKISMDYNREHNLDTKDLENRLKEIAKTKKQD